MVGRLAGDLRLARDFTRDLAELGRKGQASILYTAEKQPAVFFATSARILPSDVRVTVEQLGVGFGRSLLSCLNLDG